MQWKKPLENLEPKLKWKKPLYCFLSLVFYIINYIFEIFTAKEIIACLCIIFCCIVLFQDTIYKCVDRICKRDENIEKEITKRTISKDKNTNIQDNDADIKIYDIKHRNHRNHN